MTNSGYENFDHTADMGIRAWSADLPGLLHAAADGMYSIIGTLATTGDCSELFLKLSGADEADVLRRFLAELLFIFERDHRVMIDLKVREYDAKHLSAELVLAALDDQRSEFCREVKAVTYHELAITRTESGYEARIIVDI